MRNQFVLIIDFGGQNNQLVARRVREHNVYCEVKPYTISIEEIRTLNPVGIILTGVPNSVYDEKASRLSKEISELNIPILEMNYGYQPMGSILKDFLLEECKCVGDWTMARYIDSQIEEIRKTVGNGKALCALSGGVDSSVVAALMSKAIGNQLTCVFVDTGLMRKNEGDEVEAAFSKNFDSTFIRVNAQDRFLNKLKGITDPEAKRKAIGEEFIRVFEDEAKKIGKVDFLVQGTIYPDIIESGIGGSGVIKSHHNVGGLPSVVDFKELIEPLKFLFKDEVRKLGQELNLPEYLVWRQPFPGPGLGIRVIGEVTKEKLDILRDADYIFREEIAIAGLDKDINQYFAVITDIRSVGVSKAERTYDYTLALRGVVTTDFMEESTGI